MQLIKEMKNIQVFLKIVFNKAQMGIKNIPQVFLKTVSNKAQKVFKHVIN